MARKCPRAGDIVRSLTLPTFGVGYIERCEGDSCVYSVAYAATRKGHSGLQFVRRDSVEIVSSANSR